MDPGRPGLREALAAVRKGETLAVTKLDRLARSLPDARDIADELTRRGVTLNLGGSVYDHRLHPTRTSGCPGRLPWVVVAVLVMVELAGARWAFQGAVR